jgi:hypothetical protein
MKRGYPVPPRAAAGWNKKLDEGAEEALSRRETAVEAEGIEPTAARHMVCRQVGANAVSDGETMPAVGRPAVGYRRVGSRAAAAWNKEGTEPAHSDGALMSCAQPRIAPINEQSAQMRRAPSSLWLARITPTR